MDSDSCQTVIIQLPANSSLYDVLRNVQTAYKPFHIYLSIILCIFGAITNFCNIVILTRKQMRTPVNTILTAMACCDTVVLFSNLIYTTHYSFVAFKHCLPKHWSYGWALFLIAHAHLSLVGHSSSVWLSVMLALIRYLTLRSRGNVGGMQIGLKHSHAAIGIVISFVAIVNAPNFLTYKIDERRLVDMCHVIDPRDLDAPAYLPGIADMAVMNHCIVFRLAFWISGTIFKVVPCICLSVLVWLLLRILKEVKANHARLLKSTSQRNARNGVNAGRGSIGSGSAMNLQRTPSLKATNRGERTDRTTHMLLAIVAVLLVTEMPQGIMAVLSGVFSEEFRIHVYNSLGDLLDLLSLCGACTSFIIYCSMSGQFRNEFRRVFLPDSLSHCIRQRAGRRASEAYTKLTLLARPSELHNNSDIDRSIAITVVGSAMTVRKDPLKEGNGGLLMKGGVRGSPLVTPRGTTPSGTPATPPPRLNHLPTTESPGSANLDEDMSECRELISKRNSSNGNLIARPDDYQL